MHQSTHRFPKAARLVRSSDYDFVFAKARKIKAGRFLLLCRENQLKQPRLGIILGKKKIALASRRNTIKRIVRESFRQTCHELPALDFIVLWTQKMHTVDKAEIREALNKQWTKLAK